ncbi:hypothetical protein AT984_07050 [Paucibacter sp. KCTC 42545]|nr:hypothetical protein AT984_07050 [Paucibacter sp. KCTC 42545]
MDDIKARINRINKIIVVGHSPMKSEPWDTEVVFLFLRKSLEQLVFSWLVANKDAYADAHKDFATNWKLKNLIKRIAALNEDFYPKPVLFPEHANSNGVKQLADVEDGFLTCDELETLYDLSSEVLHTWNPYRPGAWHLDTGKSIAEWVQRLQRLLDHHYIRLLDGSVWLVQMVHPVDGKTHAFLAAPAPGGVTDLAT